MKHLLVRRIQNEAAISDEKVPIVLALACLWQKVEVSFHRPLKTMQSTNVRHNADLSLADLDLLRSELAEATTVHFSIDMSERDNQPHYQIILSYSGPLVSKSSAAQSDQCFSVFETLRISSKVGYACSDSAPDIIGEVGGTLVKLKIRNLQCDLHVLNDCLVKAITESIGDPTKRDDKHIVQIAYRLHWCLHYDLAAAPLPPLPITTRWETIIPAMSFLVENVATVVAYLKYCHEKRDSKLTNLRNTAAELHDRRIWEPILRRRILLVQRWQKPWFPRY